MRGTKAKRIRKQVYGPDMSPRYRKYLRDGKTGQVIADPRRSHYQQTKKASS